MRQSSIRSCNLVAELAESLGVARRPPLAPPQRPRWTMRRKAARPRENEVGRHWLAQRRSGPASTGRFGGGGCCCQACRLRRGARVRRRLQWPRLRLQSPRHRTPSSRAHGTRRAALARSLGQGGAVKEETPSVVSARHKGRQYRRKTGKDYDVTSGTSSPRRSPQSMVPAGAEARRPYERPLVTAGGKSMDLGGYTSGPRYDARHTEPEERYRLSLAGRMAVLSTTKVSPGGAYSKPADTLEPPTIIAKWDGRQGVQRAGLGDGVLRPSRVVSCGRLGRTAAEALAA